MEQKEKTGFIYVLTNESFHKANWIKIGYAEDVDKRVKDLSGTSVPLPYKVYCTYEIPRINGAKDPDKLVHNLIQLLNPSLRISSNREFFEIDPWDAYDMLSAIAQMHGRSDKLKFYGVNEPDKPELIDEEYSVESLFPPKIELFKKVLEQKRCDKDKVYSLHEPEVKCIGKGKEHKKYEFGNKVSIARSYSGIIVGAVSFRDEYDGHTIDDTLDHVEQMLGFRPSQAACDRGYRGQKESGTTKIVIPDVPKKNVTYYQKEKAHKLFCKRAGIEPINGHLKSDHRMGRNFYKGIFGDMLNAKLAAAAFNFKRAMRRFFVLLEWLYCCFLCREGVNKNGEPPYPALAK